MKLSNSPLLAAAALAAGTLFTAPAQAQSAELARFKVEVGATVVLGETARDGDLRVLNNGPATLEVRWFDAQRRAWDSQLLEAGQSLMGERGRAVRVSEDSLVCMIGHASKEKAGLISTSGLFSMESALSPSKGKGTKTKPQPKTKPATKTKPQTKTKPATKSKPQTKSKPATKSKPQTKSKPATKSKPQAKAKPATKSKPQTKVKPAAKSKPQPKTKPAPPAKK